MKLNEEMFKFLSVRNFYILPKNSVGKKFDAYYTDDVWSMDLLHPIDYASNKSYWYLYILIVTDNFWKFGCTVP